MDAAESEGWRSIGRHAYRFEPPDVYFVRVIGSISGDEMRRMLEVARELAARAGDKVIWLEDISQLGDVSPEARKMAASMTSTPSVRATVLFGGSFHQRVVANLVIQASKLLRTKRLNLPIVFLATEAEARAFIERLRRGLVAG